MKYTKGGDKQMAKPRKVTLTLLDIRNYHYPQESFKVISIQNSIEWQVGQCLSEDEVNALLNDRGDFLTINIKGNN